MKKIFLIIFLLSIALPGQAEQAVWSGVEKILGKGTVKEDMFKVSYPRTDLDVKMGDVRIDARVGLTSWIAFRADQQTVVMGALVLKVDEVQPVIQKLQAEKIRITALGNDLAGASIPVMHLHFQGSGDAVKLANALKAALSATGTPLSEAPRLPETIPPEFSVVEYFLGEGRQQGSVLKYNFPRNQTIAEDDMEIPGFMGTYTSLNFQGSGGKVAATGDFVVTANEVKPVIKTLTDNNITVTAVRNDMLDETPRLFFVHFWGYDTPDSVASGLRAALDKVNVRGQSE